MLFKKQSLAQIISRLAGPPTEIPLVILLALRKESLSRTINPIFLVIFLFLGWWFPISFFVFAMRRGWIKDVDATDRADRYLPYIVTLICLTLIVISARVYSLNIFLGLFQPFYVLCLVLLLVTFKYKISVHAAINTALYLLLNQLNEWTFWWLFPLVIIVCWSRWVRQKHSLGQLSLGVAVALVVWAVF